MPQPKENAMPQPPHTTLRVTQGGRIVIPAVIRHRLGMEVGSDIILTLQDDHATLMNAKAARKRARDWVRKYAKPNTSLSKELMAERKAEAARE
jgi:AbrB family looped-hinge helix DNA binding protein